MGTNRIDGKRVTNIPSGNIENFAAAVTGSMVNIKFALLQETTASGVAGPTLGSSMATHNLTTEVLDPNNIVTLSANQFTLASGTYIIRYQVSNMTSAGANLFAKLKNMTDALDVTSAIGSATFGNGYTVTAVGSAGFTITSSKAYAIQAMIASSATTSPNTGLNNQIWCSVEIIKIA